jgi:hypothetical protein
MGHQTDMIKIKALLSLLSLKQPAQKKRKEFLGL